MSLTAPGYQDLRWKDFTPFLPLSKLSSVLSDDASLLLCPVLGPAAADPYMAAPDSAVRKSYHGGFLAHEAAEHGILLLQAKVLAGLFPHALTEQNVRNVVIALIVDRLV